MLDAHGITCSMSRTGDCYDNAVMEAFFSTVKWSWPIASRAPTAKKLLFDYLEVFDNQRRRHSTIGYVSPAAFERAAVESAMRVYEGVLAGILQPAPPDDRRSRGIL